VATGSHAEEALNSSARAGRTTDQDQVWGQAFAGESLSLFMTIGLAYCEQPNIRRRSFRAQAFPAFDNPRLAKMALAEAATNHPAQSRP